MAAPAPDVFVLRTGGQYPAAGIHCVYTTAAKLRHHIRPTSLR
jgi:hypothetical protein